MSAASKRFRVALSFAGEKREYVAKIAAILAERFGEAAVLYDKYHEAEFARSDLAFHLQNLYHAGSDLIVVVVCENYGSKEWCGLEWNAIFDLLKKRKNEEIMLCRFDLAAVRGLYSTAGFVELDDKTAEYAAARILERLALNEGKPKDYYSSDALSEERRRREKPGSASDILSARQRTHIESVIYESIKERDEWVSITLTDLGGTLTSEEKAALVGILKSLADSQLVLIGKWDRLGAHQIYPCGLSDDELFCHGYFEIMVTSQNASSFERHLRSGNPNVRIGR